MKAPKVRIAALYKAKIAAKNKRANIVVWREGAKDTHETGGGNTSGFLFEGYLAIGSGTHYLACVAPIQQLIANRAAFTVSGCDIYVT